MKQRIDILRGLACLLLVTYHVIGADAGFGLQVQQGVLRWLNDGLVYLRMPLFTCLSGVVYGMNPRAADGKAFLLGKARRLLIPMLVVGTVFALLQFLTPGTNSSAGPWYYLHLKPVAHFWFVEALFWVFLLLWLLERYGLIEQPGGCALALALAGAAYLTLRGGPWLGLDGAIYLLPYFLLGLAFTRFSLDAAVRARWSRWLLAAVAIAAVLSLGLPVPNPDRRSLPVLLAGVSLCLLCLGSRANVAWLRRVGGHSYAIYLFHVFFTAAGRIALERTGFDGLLLNLSIGVALGLAGPMLLEQLVAGSRWSALLLLGRSLRASRAVDRGLVGAAL